MAYLLYMDLPLGLDIFDIWEDVSSEKPLQKKTGNLKSLKLTGGTKLN